MAETPYKPASEQLKGKNTCIQCHTDGLQDIPGLLQGAGTCLAP